MNRLQNQEFFEQLDRISTFMLANLLWVLFAIPLITLPAATAGLFTTMSRWVRGESVEAFRDFFRGMRQHWRKATIIGIIDIVFGGLVLLNFSIFRLMNMEQILTLLSQGVTLFVALTGLMVNLYMWPLMVTVEDLSLRRLFDLSVRMVFAHPTWSVMVLILALLPFAVSLILPAALLILVSFSGAALLVSWGTWRIIRQYLPPESSPNG